MEGEGGSTRTVLAVRGLLYQLSMNGVLLLRRHSKANFSPCMWELPGGKIEANSISMGTAVATEYAQETGIAVVATQPPLYVWDKPAGLPPKYPGNVRYQCTVLRVHLVYPEVREVRLSEEHDDYRWIQPTPEAITPYGDYIPKETRDALEIFYQHYILFPRLLRGEQV